jgi:hypothetical protein
MAVLMSCASPLLAAERLVLFGGGDKPAGRRSYP